MKKNFIYGVISGCVAMLLLIGAVMSMPDEPQETPASTGNSQETQGSTGVATTAPKQTTAPSSQPTEATTQPTGQTTQPTQQETVLQVITWPETVSGGETGTVTVKGKPNTAYTIKVYYKSGPSSAKGLEETVSDAEGFVTWTWKVSKNTTPGDFKIVVTGGGETVEVPFSVVE